MAATINEDLTINATLRAQSLGSTPLSRDYVITESLRAWRLPLQDFKVWDAFGTALPNGAGTNDDLGLTAGAFGTGIPYLDTRDLNAAGAVTHYARTQFVLPHEYVTGGAITVRLCSGMITAVASVSSTADVECYLCARSNLVSGSDICTTAAQSNNSTTFAELSFTITPTSRVAGEVLDIRVALAANSATGSSHFSAISHAEVLLTVRG